MNRDSHPFILKNPWQEREKLPSVSPIHKILAAIAVFLSALSLPICLWKGISSSVSEGLGIVLLVLLGAYAVKVARSTPALTWLICTAVVLAFFVGMSITGTALVLAVIVSIAAGAFLMTVTGRPYLTVICHMAAFGVSYVITRDVIGSLLTFSVLPASLLTAYATLKGMWRTRVICFATGGLLLTAAVMLVFHLLYVGVPFEREALASYVDTLRTDLTDLTVSRVNEMLEVLRAEGTDSYGAMLYEQFKALYTDETVYSMVVLIFNILPALLICVCMVISFEASSLLLAAHGSAGLEAVNTDKARHITVGIPASVIYVLSFLLILILPSDTLASAVVQNLVLILLPGLAICGASRLILLLRRSQGILRFLLLFAVVALMCSGLGTGLYLLALWGAYGNVSDLIRVILIQRMRKNGDGDGPRE